jgi:MFS family permease
MSLLPAGEAATPEVPAPEGWRRDLGARFAALRHRNFRLFWTAQGISVIGTWMQSVALYWLMYRLTKSPFLLGLTGVALTLPILCFSLVGGVVADHLERRRLVQTTQMLNLLQALVLATLVTFTHPGPVPILALALANGMVNAFDFPARQSFLSELVPPDALPNAIALNSMAFNSARLIGPAIAGVILARAGEAMCFWLNAASYVPLLWSLRQLRLEPRARAARPPTLVTLLEGVRYAFGTPRIRHLLVLMGLAGTLGFQYPVLMPVYAGTLLGAGPRGYGLLMSAAGLGAVFATLTLTARLERPGLRRALFVGLSLFGVGLVAFSTSRQLWLSAGLSLVVGFGMILYAATTNTLLQITVLDEYRGRVMSLFTLMLVGTAPVGAFLMGTIAERMGARLATGISGGVCLLGALWVAHRTRAIARREAAIASAATGEAPPSTR